jgi:hypothetical protein
MKALMAEVSRVTGKVVTKLYRDEARTIEIRSVAQVEVDHYFI